MICRDTRRQLGNAGHLEQHVVGADTVGTVRNKQLTVPAMLEHGGLPRCGQAAGVDVSLGRDDPLRQRVVRRIEGGNPTSIVGYAFLLSGFYPWALAG